MNLKNIRKYLKKGDRTKIANKLNVSRATVYAVLSGERRNDDIIEEALRIASERKKNSENLIKQLNNL